MCLSVSYLFSYFFFNCTCSLPPSNAYLKLLNYTIKLFYMLFLVDLKISIHFHNVNHNVIMSKFTLAFKIF